MVDRETLLALLRHRFPNSTAQQIAAAANAIVSLDQEWDEISLEDAQSGCPIFRAFSDICPLSPMVRQGARVFQKRTAEEKGLPPVPKKG